LKKPSNHFTEGWVGPRGCLDWFRKSAARTLIQSQNQPGRSKSLYPRHEAGGSKYTSTPPSALVGHWWLTCSHQINSGKEPQYPFIKSWMGSRAIQDVVEKRKILVPTRIQTLDHPTSGTRYSDQATWLPKFQPTTGHEGLALAALPPGKKHCTHCTGGWVGKRARP
jgi:hypothetical protein